MYTDRGVFWYVRTVKIKLKKKYFDTHVRRNVYKPKGILVRAYDEDKTGKMYIGTYVRQLTKNMRFFSARGSAVVPQALGFLLPFSWHIVLH